MSRQKKSAMHKATYVLLAILFTVAVPSEAQSMRAKCLKKEGGAQEICSLDIYNSVLKGRNGNQVRVRFASGYLAEAFCVDPESKDCLVRSTNSGWEKGRIRWVQNYPGFRAAFFIETRNGLTLGVYDAPPSY